MQRSLTTGISSVEADQALCHGLSLLGTPISQNKLASYVRNHVPRLVNKYIALSKDKEVEIQEAVTGQRVAILPIKQASILTLSHDGRYLVAQFGENEPTIEVWDIPNGRLVSGLTHSGKNAVFSANDKYLVFSDGLGLSVYSMNTRKQISYTHTNESTTVLGLSSDGKHITTLRELEENDLARKNETQNSSDRKSNLETLDTSTGTNDLVIGQIEVNSRRRFSEIDNYSNDRYIAVWNKEQPIVQILDTDTGLILTKLQIKNFGGIIISPDGKYLVTFPGGWGVQKLQLWNVADNLKLSDLLIDQYIYAVAFSQDGKSIAVASGVQTATANNGTIDFTIQVWDIATSKEIARLNYPKTSLSSLAFSPNGKILTAIDYDGKLWAWELAKGTEIAHIATTDSTKSIAFSPDASYVTTATDKLVQVWHTFTGQEFQHLNFDQEGNSTTLSSLSSDGRYIAITNNENVDLKNTQIWDIFNKRKLINLPKELGELVVLSRNGKYASAPEILKDGGRGQTIRIWDVDANQQIASLKHKGGIESLAFSLNNKYLATGSYEGADYVWTTNGRNIARLAYQNRSVTDYIAISPDEKYLATASHRYSKVWIREVSTGREVAQVRHEDLVDALNFSPDGKFLATGGLDGTARIWKVSNGQEIARIQHENPVYFVTFSLDGKYLSTLTQDGARIWIWRSTDLISEACNRLLRNLTLSEWHKYIGNERYHKTCPNLPAPQGKTTLSSISPLLQNTQTEGFVVSMLTQIKLFWSSLTKG